MSEAQHIAAMLDPDKRPGTEITRDKPCPACGYNLEGLRLGGTCPECGRAIWFGKKDDAAPRLLEAPSERIRLLQVGVALMAIAPLVALAALMGSLVEVPVGMGLMAASVVWLAGVVLLGIHGQPPESETQRSKDVARRRIAISAAISQAPWFLAAAVNAFSLSPGSSGPWILGGLAALGTVGFVPTFWTVAAVSEYVDDDERAGRVRIATVMLAAALLALVIDGVAQSVLPSALSAVFTFVRVFATLALLGSALYLVWSMIQTTVTLGWAVRVAATERERIERFYRKLREERARGVGGGDSSGDGGPVSPAREPGSS